MLSHQEGGRHLLDKLRERPVPLQGVVVLEIAGGLGSLQPAPGVCGSSSALSPAPGQAPQAPQLCSLKGRHFFQCRSVSYPTCWGWPALPWSPASLSGSPGPLELTRKAGFPLKGDFCSHCKLSCPAAAWVVPAHVTPARGSWLCPPDVSRGDAASSATRCSQSVGKRQVSNCCG